MIKNYFARFSLSIKFSLLTKFELSSKALASELMLCQAFVTITRLEVAGVNDLILGNDVHYHFFANLTFNQNSIKEVKATRVSFYTASICFRFYIQNELNNFLFAFLTSDEVIYASRQNWNNLTGARCAIITGLSLKDNK